VLDIAYENVYDAVAREVKEETGCTVERFIDSDQTDAMSPKGTDKVFGFKPFCCTQQLLDGRPWIGFIFRVAVYPQEPKDQIGESKDVRWMKIEEILSIYKSDPGQLFTLEVPAWEYYFRELKLL
jgi:8-oxo-dGTP diphosphatase